MFNAQLILSNVLILFFALGFCTSAQIISYPAINAVNNSNLVGGALGLASVLIMSGGAVFEPMFSWLLQLNWQHTMHNGMPVYSQHDYLIALAIMPITFIAGILLTLLAQEPKNTKLQQD